MQHPIIEIKNLNYIYNERQDNEFRALLNINLKIYPKEFVIIFGPSGCGKSTLLDIIAGLKKPTSGEITVYGQNLGKATNTELARYHRTKIGIIYRQFNLIDDITILENVALPQIFLNVKKKERQQKAAALLAEFNLADYKNKYPKDLVRCEQSKVDIARALINNAQIILADEPMGNLDFVSAKKILGILREIYKKKNKTIILITHNPEFLNFGTRTINMKDGMIVRDIISKYTKAQRQELASVHSNLSNIDTLSREYKGLSSEQINFLIMPYKAKFFAQHFLSSRNMEETKAFEDAIQRRLLGIISEKEFFNILCLPSEQGGVGFDRKTAEKLMHRIERATRITYFIYQNWRQKKNEDGEHEKVAEEEKVDKLSKYLLETCYPHNYRVLDDLQMQRFKKAVADRLNGRIQKYEFKKILEDSVADAGVGLPEKIARDITEEIELIFVFGYGVTQKVKIPVKK